MHTRSIVVELTSLSSAHVARVTIRDEHGDVIGGREFQSNASAWTYVEQYTVNAHNALYTLRVVG